MVKRPALSKAETEIARIVWDRNGGTVRDVLESLPRDRELDYKTVQTYLRRLEAKGYLKSEQKSRSRWYVPRVKPGQVIRETVNDFVKRLFDGEALPLVEHLIRDSDLSGHDIRRLRSLLTELENQGDGSRS